MTVEAFALSPDPSGPYTVTPDDFITHDTQTMEAETVVPILRLSDVIPEFNPMLTALEAHRNLQSAIRSFPDWQVKALRQEAAAMASSNERDDKNRRNAILFSAAYYAVLPKTGPKPYDDKNPKAINE